MRYTGDSEAVFNVYDGEILDFCALVRSEADQFMGMPPHPTTEVLAGVTNADVLAEILKQARSFDSHQVRLDSGEPALAVLLTLSIVLAHPKMLSPLSARYSGLSWLAMQYS